MRATNTFRFGGCCSRFRVFVVVAVAASSLATMSVGTAAATSATGGTMTCTGTISPGLTSTPTAQSFTASCSGSETCSLTGSSTIAETVSTGTGTFVRSCLDGSGSGTYDRASATMTFSGSGSWTWVCVFEPDQTPPGTVTSFHLLCVSPITGSPGTGGGPSGPSSACSSGVQITNTTVAGEQVWLYIEQPDPNTEWFCWRVQDASTLLGYGGQLVITNGSGIGPIGTPTIDNNSAACSTTSGNQVPGPHPLVVGTTLGLAYLFDVYTSVPTGAAWACLAAGPESYRVVLPFPAPTASAPRVTFNPDPGTP